MIFANQTECSNKSYQFLLALTDTILIVYPWLMIIFGTISNITSFIVVTRSKLRKSSTFFYLSCLSVIDLVLLYTFCINFIFFYQFKIDLQLKHLILCKLYSFLIYFLPQFSAWTCVAVSLDRVVGVIFSVRGRYASAAKKFNTPQIAIKVMLFIFFWLFLINLQFFFYPNEYNFEHNESNQIQDINLIYCSPENIPRFQTFYNIWVYIDLSINVLIPFAIMIASSVIIVIGISKSTKNLSNRRLLSQTSQEGTRSETDRKMSSVNLSRAKSSQSASGSQSDPLMRPRKSLNFVKRASTVINSNVTSKAKNVSYMLAANNFVFISLTLPIVVFLSVVPSFSHSNICDYEKAKLRLIKVICIILMNSNCSINIFIYSFMSSEFRNQLIALVKSIIYCCFKTNSNSINLQLRKTQTIKQNSSGDIQDSQSKKVSS